MDFTYFILDKNPKQFKKLSVNGYEIELRIEWNIRGNAWYVLGYIKDDIVLRNTKFEARKVYSFDNDTPYDLPYSLMIYPESSDNDWNTETYFVYYEDVLANADQGMSESGVLIDRRYGTSSSTHSKKALRSDDNKYLFDVIVPYVEELWELQSASLLDGRGVYSFKRGSESVDLNVDLTEAITASLSDVDMQQWQAVKDAANELTGVTDWVLDPANNRIRYFQLKDEVYGGASFGCNGSTSNSQTLESALDTCTLANWTQVKLTQKGNETLVYTLAGMQVGQTKSVLLEVSVVDTNNSNPTPVDTNIYLSVTKVEQPAEQEEKYLPLETVAAQVISNAQSDNQGVSLFAETYLESIVNSVNETDPTKQFITLDYLKSLL